MIGYIYKITSPQTNKYYIGSTVSPINIRFSNHKSDYDRYLNGKHNYVSSFEVVKFPNAEISLIETFELETNDKENFKLKLREREGEYIKLYKNEIVNMYIPRRTRKEYREDNKNELKQYREQNKDKLKEYYEQNKDELKQYKKQYYEQNKEKIREQRSQKINCLCGSSFRRAEKSQHEKTKKHQTFIKNQTNNTNNINNTYNIQTLNITVTNTEQAEQLIKALTPAK